MNPQRERHRELARTAIPVALVLALGTLLSARNPEFFVQGDMLTQYMPASQDIARAIWSGAWPLLTPYSWYGASLAGEYQHAVFSPFEMALTPLLWSAKLSLAHTAAAFVLVHMSILAAGAFRLARVHGCGTVEASIVGLIASANGWMMNWGAANWYPSLTSFAWLPWAWWALASASRSARVRPTQIVLAAVFITFILSAGWLFSCAMMLLVSAWIAVTSARSLRSMRPILIVALAWIVALGLASPALAMLVDYSKNTERAQVALSLNRGFLVPFEGFFGMALPSYHAYWNYLDYSGIRRSTELGGALVPCACWLSALAFRGRSLLREQGPLIVLVAICGLLATSPSIEGLRCSFRWLPLFHLSVALLGMQAWSLARAPAWWPAAAASAITAFVWLRALGLKLDPSPISLYLGAWLLALCLGWLALARAGVGPAVMLAFVAGSFACSYSSLPPHSEELFWEVPSNQELAEPLDRNVRYLTVWTFDDIVRLRKQPWLPLVLEPGGLRPGYTALLARVQVINGYSSVGERALSKLFGWRIHGDSAPGTAPRLLREIMDGGPLLRAAAVDGLIIASRYKDEIRALKQRGWRWVGKVASGVVLQREGPASPRVRSVGHALLQPSLDKALTSIEERAPSVLVEDEARPGSEEHFAQATVTLLREERLRSVARVSVGQGPALITFARPWLRGWRARVGDRELEVLRYNGIMPAVRVPAGTTGELELWYFPRVLQWALVLVAVVMVTCLAACARELVVLKGRRATP